MLIYGPVGFVVGLAVGVTGMVVEGGVLIVAGSVDTRQRLSAREQVAPRTMQVA